MKPDNDNFFISPFSLNIALSTANEGAKTSTRKEMDQLLCIQNVSDRAFLYKELIQQTITLKDSDCLQWSEDKSNGNEIFLANSLWINEAFKIDGSFKHIVEDNYNSEIFDFDKYNVQAANKKLIDWISNSTNNKINEMSGLDPDIMLSIINAIYFIGEWNDPFDARKTKVKKFHTITKDKTDAAYMRKQTFYKYYEDSDIQCIYLPYKCHQFSMSVILPREKYGIDKIEEKLDSEFYANIDSLSSSYEVILSLPKFRIESEIYPIKDIIRMGYSEMFSDKADFTNISNIDSLKIGNIIHKTLIEVDEQKTEAAAVSKVDMVLIGYGAGKNPPPPPPPKIFNANHPFIFLIVDNRTKAVVFIGKFVK